MTDQAKAGQPVGRRTLLQLAGAAIGGAGLPALAADQDFPVANPKYNALYQRTGGYYTKDPQWVSWTRPRLSWPQAGEKLPELTVVIPTVQTNWLDAWRKFAADGGKLGLAYNIQQVSEARWLDTIQHHTHGDIEVHSAILRPERVDPSEWLTSRAYGLDRRNYGEWVNQQYDALIEAQVAESDPAKRLKLVRDAQRVLADDLYIAQFGWGPGVIEAYNSAAWDGVVQTRGFGIGSFNAFHTFLRARPKTARRKMIVGIHSLLETTNIIAAGNNMRAIGRMIYDRLAYLDENLKIIPWAAESWTRVDERTWDIKLRPGMNFHDGKPVTIDDLQFTFDFMLKWERGNFWTANRFLQKTEIKDAANGILRATFKQPYGQFESYFLQLNVILPKHIWQNIMTEQGVGSDPMRVRIDKPIGSGPFKFGRYRADAELQLIADKTHFSKPSVNEVWAVVTPSIDGLLGRLQGGDIDLIEFERYPSDPQPGQAVRRHLGHHDRPHAGPELAARRAAPVQHALARLRVPSRLATLDRPRVPGEGGVGRLRPAAARQHVPGGGQPVDQPGPAGGPAVRPRPGARHPQGGRLFLGERRQAGLSAAERREFPQAGPAGLQGRLHLGRPRNARLMAAPRP